MQTENKLWCVIVLAGGSGTRMGAGKNKVLIPLWDGTTPIERSVRAFLPFAEKVIVVIRQEDKQEISRILGGNPNVVFACGGSTRQESVWNGLQCVSECAKYVMIHDGARFLVDEGTIRRVMDSVQENGTGVASIPLVDTIKQFDEKGNVCSTPDRNRYRVIQTPQGFCKEEIIAAHRKAQLEGFTGTDDAALAERMGISVHLVDGSRKNIKLTNPEDMEVMEQLSGEKPRVQFRIGSGYDVHKLTHGRPLIMCGVNIPHTMGLLGHSDADVAVHALMDAMLGALALGDIGHLFPDNDKQYEGISSILLLEKVSRLCGEHNAALVNADITIAAQKPKFAPYIEQMRETVSLALSCDKSVVSIKATTTEHLGFEGREEGISATAVVMMEVCL